MCAVCPARTLKRNDANTGFVLMFCICWLRVFLTLDISHKSFFNWQILNSEISTLLGYYAAYTGHSLPTFRDTLSVLSSNARMSRNVGK